MTLFGTMNEKAEIIYQMEIDLSKVQSSDPIAFAYGISRGQYYSNSESGQKELKYGKGIQHGAKHSELAKEYLRGFLLGYRGFLIPEGTKIMKGHEQTYYYSHLNLLKK